MIRLTEACTKAAAVAVVTTTLFVGCAKPTTPGAKATSPAAAPKAAVAPEGTASGKDGGIAVLIEKLKAADGGTDRVVVIDEIGAAGQNAQPALDALVAALADAEPNVRWHAARAIGLIGEDAITAVPAIVTLLDDADPVVVAQAAAALGAIRHDDGRAVIPAKDAEVYAATLEPLAKTLVHADPRARRAAIRALGRLSPSSEVLAPIVAKQLADADHAVVLAAMHSLADIGAPAVPFLVEALKNPSSRYWAEVALAEIGPAAAAAVEPLAASAAEGEIPERLQAILCLAAIGEPAASAASAVTSVLDSNEESLRLAAAFALGRMRSPAADASLKKAVAGNDPFVAAVAAWALARIHPDDKALVADAVSRLRKQVASDDPEARAAGVAGLTELAESLDDATRTELADAFLSLLSDPHRKVEQRAGAGLIRLGASGVPALRAKITDPALRLKVIEVLGALGTSAKPALADLIAAVGDADEEVRGDAAVAIAAIGAEAAEAVPSLQKVVTDASLPAGVRYAAVYALGRIGPSASAAEPALRELVGSDDELMATVAVWAALKIKPDDQELRELAVPRLRRALRGDREMVRLEAAVALGDIGAPAASAVPILELVAEDDPMVAVRAAAAAAVAKIKGS